MQRLRINRSLTRTIDLGTSGGLELNGSAQRGPMTGAGVNPPLLGLKWRVTASPPTRPTRYAAATSQFPWPPQ
jgi:hypothetical protein